MVDFIRNNIDRIMRLEKDKVNGLNKSTIIHKESENRRQRKGQNFNDELKKKQGQKRKGYKAEKRSEKELLESNIIVESSLNKELEKNRKISELVNEKFVNNENLKGQIDFENEELHDDSDIIDKVLSEARKYGKL